jgi:hypothetical protein
MLQVTNEIYFVIFCICNNIYDLGLSENKWWIWIIIGIGVALAISIIFCLGCTLRGKNKTKGNF